MICLKCGKSIEEGADICPECVTKIENESKNSNDLKYTTHITYAGFWKRFAAHLIDRFIIGIVFYRILQLSFVPALTSIVDNAFRSAGYADNYFGSREEFNFVMENRWDDIVILSIQYLLAFFVVIWLYYAIMESSKLKATLGKLALGIKVADANGNKISFLKASGRYLSKIVSGLILCIGYVMAGFTEKKQALHDIMADSLVINK
ncbi:MAG: RDD family protein [Clostridiaceae bacterium]